MKRKLLRPLAEPESLLVPAPSQRSAPEEPFQPLYANASVQQLARIIRAQTSGLTLDGNVTWVLYWKGARTTIACPEEVSVPQIPQIWQPGPLIIPGTGLFELDLELSRFADRMRMEKRLQTPLPKTVSRRQGKLWVLFEALPQ